VCVSRYGRYNSVREEPSGFANGLSFGSIELCRRSVANTISPESLSRQNRIQIKVGAPPREFHGLPSWWLRRGSNTNRALLPLKPKQAEDSTNGRHKRRRKTNKQTTNQEQKTGRPFFQKRGGPERQTKTRQKGVDGMYFGVFLFPYP
jgi:hypothetical protein